MKTIEIIRYTGETEKKTVDGETVETPVYEIKSTYTCEDGEENNLLARARLTAEIWTRDKEGDFQARIQT